NEIKEKYLTLMLFMFVYFVTFFRKVYKFVHNNTNGDYFHNYFCEIFKMS
ncbi:hypothetical protein NT05LI_0807, partial [Listeria ivanovii FSL F6-596]